MSLVARCARRTKAKAMRAICLSQLKCCLRANGGPSTRVAARPLFAYKFPSPVPFCCCRENQREREPGTRNWKERRSRTVGARTVSRFESRAFAEDCNFRLRSRLIRSQASERTSEAESRAVRGETSIFLTWKSLTKRHRTGPTVYCAMGQTHTNYRQFRR